MFQIEKNLRRAILFSLILNFAFAFTGYYTRTYDSGTHIFFADHYRRSWFNTWEPKWYTGFTVTSYPPLPHQSQALLSYAVGLEQAYVILVFALMVLVPVAVYEFSKVFVSKTAAGYASLISVFLSSTIQITYRSGQYPMLFGLVAALFATSFLYMYLKNGSKLYLIQSALLLGIVVSTHTVMAFFMILMFLTVISKMLLAGELNKESLTKRSFLYLTLGGLLAIIAIYPFLMFVLTAKPQAPIFHVSRTNVFAEILNGRFDGYPKLLLKLYGVTPLFMPLTAFLVYRRRNLLPLLFIGSFLFVMSLGGTTPLPLFVFGQMWESLTYGRFALLASVTFLPLFGLLCTNLQKTKSRQMLIAVLFLMFLLSATAVGYLALSRRSNEAPVELIADFLNKENGWNWRYVTLGFGRYNLARLSVLTNSTTLDGFYNTARTLPILRDSGVGFLDGAKHFQNGTRTLTAILANSSEYNLRWVFSNDEFYEPLISKNGFKRLDEKYGEVTVWIDEDAPIVDTTNATNNENVFFAYIWGIAPLCYPVGFSISFVKSHSQMIKMGALGSSTCAREKSTKEAG